MEITDLVRKGAKQVSGFKNIFFINLFSMAPDSKKRTLLSTWI